MIERANLNSLERLVGDRLYGDIRECFMAAVEELRQLRAAVAAHHAQKADGRCIEDDDRLYAAAGLPPCDRRCEGDGWPSCAELEEEVARLRALVQLQRESLETVANALEGMARSPLRDAVLGVVRKALEPTNGETTPT